MARSDQDRLRAKRLRVERWHKHSFVNFRHAQGTPALIGVSGPGGIKKSSGVSSGNCRTSAHFLISS